MAIDHIRYDVLVQQALRGMVRNMLADIARKGLPGDHHFFITFDTNAEGVKLSDRLRERYPQEMTVVLQHQFWDLKVTDDGFEVGLSFGGVAERLYVPFESIVGFADPSVQFALQFETLTAAPEDGAEGGDAEVEGAPRPDAPREQSNARPQRPARHGRTRTSVPASPAAPPVAGADADGDKGADKDGDRSGAEVVRLDRFRKK
jgi:hypothetical protein